MNVLFLLTIVTTTPFATTLMDFSLVLVTLDTLEMEFFAAVITKQTHLPIKPALGIKIMRSFYDL
jgi:hypothetical protein